LLLRKERSGMRKEMTANQLVAYNLRRAREEARLTQGQASRLLEPYLGRRWSSASFSVAERSADEGTRRREFNANELLALARAFEKPVVWFLTPPNDLEHVACGEPAEVTRKVGSGELRAALDSLGSVWAARLESLAAEMRAGDEAALRAEPAGALGIPRFEEEKEEQDD
jgi:hypothetical protein